MSIVILELCSDLDFYAQFRREPSARSLAPVPRPQCYSCLCRLHLALEHGRTQDVQDGLHGSSKDSLLAHRQAILGPNFSCLDHLVFLRLHRISLQYILVNYCQQVRCVPMDLMAYLIIFSSITHDSTSLTVVLGWAVVIK